MKLVVEGNRNVRIKCYDIDEIDYSRLPIDSFVILEDNIGYIYLGSIQEGTIDSIFQQLSNTKGLIVDMRCYPSYYMGPDLLRFVSPVDKEFAKWSEGSVKYPGLFTFRPITGKVTGNRDYFKRKIIVLIDELTYSQSEFYAMAFRVNPNSIIIGSTTIGADGDIVPVFLPGNVMTSFSGQAVYYPDGTETQRVGIIPDIEVKPTILGLQEKKDEVLNLAIALIHGSN